MAIIDADYFNANMKQLGVKASFTPDADALDVLIADASEWVENYLRRKVESGEVVETIRGRGYNRLLLDNWPIASITSVEWSDDSGSSGTHDTTLVRALDFGALEFKTPSSGPWQSYRTYTVTYDAGMDPIPNTIKRATALKVVDLFSPQFQGPREARPVELITKIETLIVDLLEPYRRERIG